MLFDRFDHPPIAAYFAEGEEITIPSGSMGGGQQTQQQKQREPKEDENNLQSLSYGRILDMVSEGPIVGLCTRAGIPITKHKWLGMGVYLNGTAMIGPNGKSNFTGVSVGQKFGYQNQPPMDGFASAEETISVSSELRHDVPINLTIEDSDTSSVSIAIRIPTLFEQIKETGDVVGTVVQINFALSTRGGAYNPKGALVVAGKTQSDFLKEFALALPRSASDPDGDFWAIRVTRATKDPDSVGIQNATFVEYFTRQVGVKLRYPMSAYVGCQFNAASFPSIPNRAYSMKGRIIKVPSNYFPEKRAYTRNPVSGVDTHVEQPWDGTFRVSWTDNPAWVFYDLCVNPRYGLGEFLEGMDKWSLYSIAKYCDAKVRNPVNGRLEPRFTCNLYLQEKNEAVKVLTDVASIFRGMTYWGNGSIIAIQDAPKDPVALFTNANVKDGRFAYSGTPRAQRHTVAIVRWNDPKDFYAPKFEYVTDADGVARYGERVIEMTAFGCTRRGQAIRFGKWGLATELFQTRLVTFTTGLEGAYPRPGDIIEVADQDLAGVRHGGRIFTVASDRKSVVVDKAITIDAADYTLTLVNPAAFTPPGESIPDSTYISGIRASQLVHRPLTNATSDTPTDTLTFTEALPDGVVRGSLWSLSSATAAVQLFRVLSVEERGSHEYEMQAVEHNPGKFDAIENNIRLETPTVTRIPDLGNISPVTDLAAVTGYTDAPEGLTLWINLTWKAPYDSNLRSFIVEQNRDGGNWSIVAEVSANNLKFTYTEKGLYSFRVYAVNLLGVRSSAVSVDVDVPNTNPLPSLKVQGLELVGEDGLGMGNLTDFVGPDAKFRWRAYSTLRAYELGDEPLGANIGQDDPYFHHYECRVFDVTSGAQVWTEITKVQNFTFTREHNAEAFGGIPRNRFRFEVAVVDKYNTMSDAAQLIVQNPAPGTPSGLTVDAGFKNIFLTWVNPPDRDLAVIRIKYTINDASFSHASVLAEVPAGTTAWAHAGITTGATYRYWLEAVDTFGNVSNPSGLASGTPGTVANADIAQFAVDVTKMFTNSVALRNDVWTNDSPAAGRIAWNDHRLVFRGESYVISHGNTPATHRYVWWKGPVFDADDNLITPGETVYRTAINHPKDTPGLMAINDFIIATNTEGVTDLAWRAIANAVIGSAYIAALAVKDGHIESVTAEKITAGIIAGEILQIGGVDGALQSTNYDPGVAGWILRGDGTAEIGSLTVRENLAFSNGYYNPDFPLRIFQARPDITCPVVTYVAGYRATATTGNPNRQTLIIKTGGTVTRQLLMYYGQLQTTPFNTDKCVPNPLISPLFFGVDQDDWSYGVGDTDELHYVARPRRLAVDGLNTFTIEAVVRGWGMMSVWYQVYDYPVWLAISRESMGNRVGPNATPANAGFTWNFACEMLDSTATTGYQTLAMAQRVKINVPKDKCILFAIAPINGSGNRDTTTGSDGIYNGFFRVTAENAGNILITEDPSDVDGADGI